MIRKTQKGTKIPLHTGNRSPIAMMRCAGGEGVAVLRTENRENRGQTGHYTGFWKEKRVAQR
jgi:hypothetical protein